MSETATKEASIARYKAIQPRPLRGNTTVEHPRPRHNRYCRAGRPSIEPARRSVWELAAVDKALTWGFPFRRHSLIAPTHRERIAVDPFRPQLRPGRQ
jgi:hypothetical protein